MRVKPPLRDRFSADKWAAHEMLFSRLADFLVEDILAASDEDILAEAAADDEDPEAVAAAVRALFEKVFAPRATCAR